MDFILVRFGNNQTFHSGVLCCVYENTNFVCDEPQCTVAEAAEAAEAAVTATTTTCFQFVSAISA